MTPEQWQQVKLLFENARQLPAGGRDAFLKEQSLAEEIRRELDSLLETYDASPEFLEGASPHLLENDEAEALPGRRIGPWRLLREIGRGGMGVVWEAERADGEYQQRVALKLLPGTALSQAGVARFREERRILALLEHPSIARLLEGGTAGDGTPYLVMEYVDGVSVDAWCAGDRRPLRERLALFLKICAAVDYAHQHLVIHRDLKPANVLVTGDGTPKLLDFGIARLLDPVAGADPPLTGSTERILTPGFASPEQIRGEPASTVSDVYSLGVLLYLMVTGKPPFAEEAGNPLTTLRAVLEQDPKPPSETRASSGRVLRGELDAVVLKALRKVPQERYPSARALSDDVEAWLAGRPVRAHADSRWRLMVKFLRRNKAQSIAATVVALSVLIGSAVSLWQAQLARRERNRALSSFKDVRQFSRSVLFELDEAVRNLPGSTPVRLLLMRRATELLDNLASRAADDAALQLELLEGYRKLGQIEGSSFSDNLGQVDAAIQSFSKAVRLGEGAVAALRGDGRASAALLSAYEDLGDALILKDPKLADDVYAKHRALVIRMDGQPRLDERTRYSIAGGYSALGYYQVQRNRLAEAKQDYLLAVTRYDALAVAGARIPEMPAHFAFTLKRLGAIYIQDGALDEAERLYRRALQIETTELAGAPDDRRQLVDRSMTQADLALILKKRQDLNGATALYEEVVNVRRAAVEADPRNQRNLGLAASGALSLASVYHLEGRNEESVKMCRLALGWLEKTPADTFQLRLRLANAELTYARFALYAAEAAPPDKRDSLLVEGQSMLRKVAVFIDHLEPDQSKPAVQGLKKELEETRALNRRLSASTAARVP